MESVAVILEMIVHDTWEDLACGFAVVTVEELCLCAVGYAGSADGGEVSKEVGEIVGVVADMNGQVSRSYCKAYVIESIEAGRRSRDIPLALSRRYPAFDASVNQTKSDISDLQTHDQRRLRRGWFQRGRTCWTKEQTQSSHFQRFL